MSEYISKEVEIEATFLCGDCRKELSVGIKYDNLGDIFVYVDTCSCRQDIIDELNDKISDLEEKVI